MSSYGWGPQDLTAPRARTLREVAADRGQVLEDAQSGWVGAVVRVEKSGGVHLVSLEDRRGKVRSFPLGFGFLFEGEPVNVVPPAPVAKAPVRQRTASGSVKVGASAPGWRAPAGSGLKASTMPNWWKRSGATTWVEGIVVDLQ